MCGGSQPNRQNHLGAAGRGDVAQVKDVLPAKTGEQLGRLLFGVRVVAAHKDRMVAARQLLGVGHDVAVHRVQCFDNLDLGKGALNLFAERVGVLHPQGGGHPLGKVEWVGNVKQDLAVQVCFAGQAQHVERGRAVGSVNHYVTLLCRVRKGSHLAFAVDAGQPLAERASLILFLVERVADYLCTWQKTIFLGKRN